VAGPARDLRGGPLAAPAGDEVSGFLLRPRLRAQLVSALAVLAACLGLAARPALAAPGDLDPSFGDDGKVTFGSYHGWLLEEPDFTSLALQANGGIVAVGDSGLVRFDSDGTYDDAFPTESEPPSLAAVTIQADGRLLAAGHAGHSWSQEDFLLRRYEPDGVPDATFAGDGTATLDFSAHEDQAKALAVQPDGKIVVVGYSEGLDNGDLPATDFALARYKADGALDSGFSGDGMRTTNFGGDDVAYDVALQPDGRIVVAGASSEDLALARYEPDGRLDHTFSGDGGKLTVRFGGWPATGARALVLRGNGKIVAAGGKSGKFALVGFAPDGSLDSGFGRDGIVTTPFTAGGGRRARAAASDLALIDDRLLAAGRANGEFAVARYRLGGRLDTGFSGDGKLRTDFDPSDADGASAIALAEGGKVVVGGSSLESDGISYAWNSGAIARYLLSEGPADADADGVRDRVDLCPQVFAPQKADGCPRIEQSISLEVGTDEYAGYISSDRRCISGARVTVYRIRRHGRTVVGRDRASWGYGDYYDYEIEAPVKPGRYRSIVERRLRPNVGWCRADRSPAEVVPRR
jgi:uncharacterized delta-60 repeat protein